MRCRFTDAVDADYVRVLEPRDGTRLSQKPPQGLVVRLRGAPGT
ncbi:MAG: hypothetical protein QM758_27605 [Armatimonas sp.]